MSKWDNELVFYGSRRHPRGMGILIRLCLLNEVEPWFIPMAEPWRNGVVEKFNHHYQNGFLRRVVVRGEKDLHHNARAFEHKYNTCYRYSKLKGQTPERALKQCHVRIRFPVALEAPQYPLPKLKKGRYHLVRFIRSDGRLDIFGEQYRLPSEAIYEYAVASIEVGSENLQVQVDGQTIEQYDYSMR
jgi:putative transposase